MHDRHLHSDEDAVSPVIGVVLMVAITVILGAVIASATLGLGQTRTATPPQASLSFSVTAGDNVTVTHDGGDDIRFDRLSVVVTGSATPTDPGTVLAGTELTTGDSWVAATGITDGDVVRVVYLDPEVDQSATIATFEL